MEEIKAFLKGKKIICDCGHPASIGHNLSNTVVIISLGGGRLKLICHNCAY